MSKKQKSGPEASNKVYKIVEGIPKGSVMTYGQIAKLVGISPRYVGYLLHHNPDPSKIPCHRVVNRKGEVARNFAFGGAEAQRKLLESEGIDFENEKVRLYI
jgi:methylated-DNA-protein-cysteine methyltransferase-like protein